MYQKCVKKLDERGNGLIRDVAKQDHTKKRLGIDGGGREDKTLEKHKQERNKYSNICREQKINYKKDKGKDQPKLFHRYINGKLKHRQGIEWLKGNGTR